MTLTNQQNSGETQREMTLDEWCARLPIFHLANKELNALLSKVEQLQRENEALKAERDELSIKAELQLPAYKDLRESFMEGAFWYERSIETGQIALDREAHKYADEIIKLRKNAGGDL